MTQGGYTVVTTMKNEGAFLLEWVAHHKALGFDDIVLCTNDCEDTTAQMAVRLAKLGLVRHHETRYKPGQSIQRRALRQVMAYDEVTKAEWVYVCDADEFLASRVGDGSARALVASCSPDVEAVLVPWRCFGTDGVNAYQEGRITTQRTRANATSGPTYVPFAFPKSLFRADTIPLLSRLGVHAPVAAKTLDRELRRELPGGVAPIAGRSILHVQSDYSVAQINHYQLRSRDSFLVKAARGKVNHTNSKIEFKYWARNDVAEESCDLIRRYDPEVERWMAELLEDRRLNTLHQRAVRWHQDKIKELQAQPEFQQMIDAIEALRSRIAAGERPPEDEDDTTADLEVEDDDEETRALDLAATRAA